MTRKEKSWQQELQRNRNEMRRLERVRFYAALVFAVIALTGLALLMKDGIDNAIFDILSGLGQ